MAETDLRRLPPDRREQLEKTLRTLAPRNDYPEVQRRRSAPSFILRMPTGTILILEEAVLRRSPSECWVYVHVFDEDRQWRASTRLNAGWKADLLRPQVVVPPELGTEVLRLDMGYELQDYAILEGRPALVHLCNSKGEALRNFYTHPNIGVGGLVPLRTPEEWEKALASPVVVEQLEALVWLGGYHMDPRIPPPENLHHEESRLAARAFEVQDRPAVRKKLEEIAGSSNAWVRAAAQLACDPKWQNLGN